MSKKTFENQQTKELTLESVPDIVGSVTFPLIMTSEQFGEYIEASNKNLVWLNEYADAQEKKEEYKGQQPQRPTIVYNNIRHLVLDIDYPGTTIDQWRPGGEMPFPALVLAVQKVMDPMISAVLDSKNSSG